MNDNVLYPCIDCGILPCFSKGQSTMLKFKASAHDANTGGFEAETVLLFSLVCANCLQGITIEEEIYREVKELWSSANHPDKLKDRINPCTQENECALIEHNGDANLMVYRKHTYPALCEYRVECCTYDLAHSTPLFNTPKEAIEAWNKENPKEDR